MKNIFALIGMLFVLTAGVGAWRGWLKAEFDEQYNVKIELNTKRASADVKDGTSKIVDEIRKNSNDHQTPGDPNHQEFVGPKLPDLLPTSPR